MSGENGAKHPYLKVVGAVATAVAAICGVFIGVMNYMTEGKQDMVQESAFNILTTRVNQNIEQMQAIENRLFELAMICGSRQPEEHDEGDVMMGIAPISPEVDAPHVEMSPTAVKADPPMPMRAPTERFDDFKAVQQYVQEENAPWEEGK